MLLKSLTLRFYALSLGIIVAGSLAAADNDGYTAIFNGKNMEGWKFFFDPKAPKDIDTSKNCTVKEGAIICSGKPTGFSIPKNHSQIMYSNMNGASLWAANQKATPAA